MEGAAVEQVPQPQESVDQSLVAGAQEAGSVELSAEEAAERLDSHLTDAHNEAKALQSAHVTVAADPSDVPTQSDALDSATYQPAVAPKPVHLPTTVKAVYKAAMRSGDETALEDFARLIGRA